MVETMAWMLVDCLVGRKVEWLVENWVEQLAEQLAEMKADLMV